jgi:hypothetical protein
MKKIICALALLFITGLHPANAAACFKGYCWFALSQDGAWTSYPPPGHVAYGNGPNIFISSHQGWTTQDEAFAFANQLAQNMRGVFQNIGNIGAFSDPGSFEATAKDLMDGMQSYYFTGTTFFGIPV